MVPLRCCAAMAHAQEAAAATREDCRRPRPSVEPTVWRPSADLNRTARANTVVPPSWPHPDALARPRPGCPVQRVHRRCGQSAPILMQAPRPGVPVTGTVPDRSSGFSGLAPRPIGDLTHQVSRYVPDESRGSRSLQGVDCVDSGDFGWCATQWVGLTAPAYRNDWLQGRSSTGRIAGQFQSRKGQPPRIATNVPGRS